MDDLETARSPGYFVRAHAGDALGKHGSRFVYELDGVAAHKGPVAADSADREQTPALRDKRVARAGVDDQPRGWRLRMSKPQPERARAAGVAGAKPRPELLAGDDRNENIARAPGGDHR